MVSWYWMTWPLAFNPLTWMWCRGWGGWESRAGADSQLLGGGRGRPAWGEAVKNKGIVICCMESVIKFWVTFICFGVYVTSAACGPYDPLGNRRCRGRPPQPAGWPPLAHPGPWGFHSPAPVLLWAWIKEKCGEWLLIRLSETIKRLKDPGSVWLVVQKELLTSANAGEMTVARLCE